MKPDICLEFRPPRWAGCTALVGDHNLQFAYPTISGVPHSKSSTPPREPPPDFPGTISLGYTDQVAIGRGPASANLASLQQEQCTSTPKARLNEGHNITEYVRPDIYSCIHANASCPRQSGPSHPQAGPRERMAPHLQRRSSSIPIHGRLDRSRYLVEMHQEPWISNAHRQTRPTWLRLPILLRSTYNLRS